MISSFSISPARRFAPRLLLALALSLALSLSASETPPPPSSPLSGLVKKLTEKRAAQSGAKPTKEQLPAAGVSFQGRAQLAPAP